MLYKVHVENYYDMTESVQIRKAVNIFVEYLNLCSDFGGANGLSRNPEAILKWRMYNANRLIFDRIHFKFLIAMTRPTPMFKYFSPNCSAKSALALSPEQ